MTWAVDIIPSMSKTTNGSVALFVAVDMFTGYIQLKSLKSRKAEELIEAGVSQISTAYNISLP